MRLLFILETRNLIHLVKKTTNADDKIAIYLRKKKFNQSI